MSSSIQATSVRTQGPINVSATQRSSVTFNIPSIPPNKETSTPSTTVAISAAARRQPENQAVQNGSFSPEMLALWRNDDGGDLGKFLKSVDDENNSIQGA